MPSTTLRIGVQAQVQQLLAYAAAVRSVREEMQHLDEYAASRPATGVAVADGGGTGPAGAAPPPAPPPGAAGAPGAPGAAPGPMPAPSGGAAGPDGYGIGPGDSRARVTGWGVQHAGMQAGSFLKRAAGAAVGLGLGASLGGFVLGSGQTYMELSRVLTELDRRFQSLDTNLANFGQTFGYTVAESAGLVDALGANLNDYKSTRQAFDQIVGFARDRGLDPNTAVHTLGGLQKVMGAPISRDDLAELLGRAMENNMGEGRFAEHVQALAALGDQAYHRTGHVDLREMIGTMALPQVVFGAGSAHAQGQMGADFVGRLSNVVGGQNPAMRSYMMRTMGYGREDGPSYIQMRKRLDAGVFGTTGAENVVDLFKGFINRGMSHEEMFRAMESVAGGQLNAYELDKLVGMLGTREGLGAYGQAMLGGEGREKYLASLTPDERKLYTKAGWGAGGLGTGPGRIPEGDRYRVQLEGMRRETGQPVAAWMLTLAGSVEDMAQVTQHLVGSDLGQKVTEGAKAFGQVTDELKEWVTTSERLRGAAAIPLRAVQDSSRDAGRAFSRGDYGEGALHLYPMTWAGRSLGSAIDVATEAGAGQ